ncbi:MAG: hypothetical protein M1832_003826 [Thelocarpon impressellum]|nr:MAG: hypothetical protein M1832_003826 [Thelocarpon impressellum]
MADVPNAKARGEQPARDMAPPPIVTVPVGEYSDGDSTTWPGKPYMQIPAGIYLQKTADMWMAAQGKAVKGTKYVLDKLPQGYAVFDKPRKNSEHRDKYIFGHPRGRPFDSPAQFFKHFNNMMHHESTSGGQPACDCKVCEVPKGPGRPRVSERKMSEPTGAVDSEGTPDVIDKLISKLEKDGVIKEDIVETMSMDWRVNQHLLKDYFKDTRALPAFVPRKGELVVFLNSLAEDQEVAWHAPKRMYLLRNRNTGEWGLSPFWQVGVVSQVPEEAVVPEDTVKSTPKRTALNRHGFKVELFHDPSSPDKIYATRQKWVPMHQLRPMCFWLEMIRGIPQSEWAGNMLGGPKMVHCVTVVDRHRIEGAWPNATIFCGALWLGFELVMVGDAVRIMPDDPAEKVDSVIAVKEIRWTFDRLDDDDDCRVNVYLRGKQFTTNPKKAPGASSLPAEKVKESLPRGMDGYTWYAMNGDDRQTEVSIDRVLGRCYEGAAMFLWFAMLEDVLDTGAAVVRFSKQFAREHDPRLEPGDEWHWTESRVEALALELYNNRAVGTADETRKPVLWRRALGIIDRASDKAGRKAARVPASSARGRGQWAKRLGRSGETSAADEAASSSEASLMEDKPRGASQPMELDEDDLDDTVQGLIDGDMLPDDAGEGSSSGSVASQAKRRRLHG